MTNPLVITVPAERVPGPGETVQIDHGDYLILVENTAEQYGDVPEIGTVIKYVPVEITAPGAQVRHAAEVRQGQSRTRVARYTLCSRTNSRKVRRRLDTEPLTNVTCAQCRARLVDEGLLAA